MSQELLNPGDVLEGEGDLLSQGRLIVAIAHHLAIPTQFHLFAHPILNHKAHIGGS